MCLIKKKKDEEHKKILLIYSDSREEVNRVAFLLDEVFSVLHELPQGHHRVIVDVELVVS